MLLELASLSQVPRADSVVKTSSPQLGAVVGDVDTAGSICVALELPETTQHIKHQVGYSDNEGFVLLVVKH